MSCRRDMRSGATRSSSRRRKCGGCRCRRGRGRNASRSWSSCHRPSRSSMTNRSWMRTAGTPMSRSRCRSSGAFLPRSLLRTPSRSCGCRLARSCPLLRCRWRSQGTSVCCPSCSRRRCGLGLRRRGRCWGTCQSCSTHQGSPPTSRRHRTKRTPDPTGICHGTRCAACRRCRLRWRRRCRCSGPPGR